MVTTRPSSLKNFDAQEGSEKIRQQLETPPKLGIGFWLIGLSGGN